MMLWRTCQNVSKPSLMGGRSSTWMKLLEGKPRPNGIDYALFAERSVMKIAFLAS